MSNNSYANCETTSSIERNHYHELAINFNWYYAPHGFNFCGDDNNYYPEFDGFNHVYMIRYAYCMNESDIPKCSGIIVKKMKHPKTNETCFYWEHRKEIYLNSEMEEEIADEIMNTYDFDKDLGYDNDYESGDVYEEMMIEMR